MTQYNRIQSRFLDTIYEAIQNYRRTIGKTPTVVLSTTDWKQLCRPSDTLIWGVPLRHSDNVRPGRIRLQCSTDWLVGQWVMVTTSSGKMRGKIVHVDRKDDETIYTLHQFPDAPRYLR